MPDHPLKRGAIPSPRSALAAAVPHSPLIGAPPTLLMKPQKISMWGNDVHGDCVTAEEAFAKACNNPEIFIPDNEVIAWATKHGVLEGAYLTQVMGFMQNDGFPEGSLIYDDGPYFSVNWASPTTLQSAIASGPVKIGVAADQIETAWRTTGGRSGWFGTGFHADPNEDHCVSLCGYGSLGWLAQQFGVQVPRGVDPTKPGYAMASGSSGYMTRTLENATTFANETDGVWELLSNQDLAFIKTANTPNGHVEVHIASRASNYQTRTVETATTFANEIDGTWQIVVP